MDFFDESRLFRIILEGLRQAIGGVDQLKYYGTDPERLIVLELLLSEVKNAIIAKAPANKLLEPRKLIRKVY